MPLIYLLCVLCILNIMELRLWWCWAMYQFIIKLGWRVRELGGSVEFKGKVIFHCMD